VESKLAIGDAHKQEMWGTGCVVTTGNDQQTRQIKWWPI